MAEADPGWTRETFRGQDEMEVKTHRRRVYLFHRRRHKEPHFLIQKPVL